MEDTFVYSIWIGKNIPTECLECIKHNNDISNLFNHKFILFSDDIKLEGIKTINISQELKDLELWNKLSENNKSDLARIYLASIYSKCLYSDCDNRIIKMPELKNVPAFGRELFADVHFFYNGGDKSLFREIYESMLDLTIFGFYWCLINVRRVYRRRKKEIAIITSDHFEHSRITTTKVFGRKWPNENIRNRTIENRND